MYLSREAQAEKARQVRNQRPWTLERTQKEERLEASKQAWLIESRKLERAQQIAEVQAFQAAHAHLPVRKMSRRDCQLLGKPWPYELPARGA